MDFLARALQEAARYGSDSWIFVRELLQNARDAGAKRATFACEETGGVSRISCRDDGEGMTFDHARRYLFTLYASSKEGSGKAAGRFGVGFWSVLRYTPERIVIRSWPSKGEPWEVVLDGGLTRATRREPPEGGRGTEIVLERAGTDGQLVRRVADAARQNARFLARRDDARVPLAVSVNGETVNERFTLPAPSAAFRRGRVLGVVALGAQSRVELFSKGLRVRSAAFLDDLLSQSAPGSNRSRVRFPELAEGLSPQALLESDDLELLLSRSDARDGKRLRRTVLLAQKELARLIERQLSFTRPEPWWRRIGERVVSPVGLTLLVVAAFAGAMSAGSRIAGPAAKHAPAVARTEAREEAVSERPATPIPAVRDLGSVYGGPQVDTIDADAPPPRLRYAPAKLELHFTALVVPRVGQDGAAERAPATAASEYRGTTCTRGCASVEMEIAEGTGLLRVPVPTGHRLDPESVTLDGRHVAVRASAADEPIVDVPAAGGILRYRTGRGAPPAASVIPAQTVKVPEEIAEAAREIAALPLEERPKAALRWTRRRIAYSTDGDVIASHREAALRGDPFLERTLAVGAGDCDVQNAVLLRMLHESGVPARLAIGYLGRGGDAAPWLHAWVEYRVDAGPWRVADASDGAPPARAFASDAIKQTRQPVVAAPSVTVRAPSSRVPLAAMVLAIAGVASLAAGLVTVTRTRRSIALDRGHDLARLLQGAIQQPAAFQHVPSLFHRRLVPCVDGRLITLAEAWALSANARLYAATLRKGLARDVARAGGRVLDRTTSEGTAVAESLGAVDLDRWQVLLGGARKDALVDALNAELRRRGERWRVHVVDGARPSPCVLELPGRLERAVAIDARETFLADLSARAEAEPARALFELAERLAAAIDLPADRRAKLLGPLARAAILQAGGAR